STEAAKHEVLAGSELVLCAAAAGIQVLSQNHLTNAKQLKIVADVNAVPPLGIQGVAVNADGVIVENTQIYGIGALAIGQLKYTVQHQLLKQMLAAEKPQVFDFMAAFSLARELVKIA
ncbi:MAG: methylenetetrahydromethanopterin dehydrogenase, partial [Methylotenera sp.]